MAYMAGIVDGEGTIGLRRHPINPKTGYRKYTPYIQLVNTHRKVVEMFAEWVGGASIYEHKGSNDGFKSRRDCYASVIGGARQVPVLLRQLLPYLIVKKDLAELILDFTDNMVRYEPKKGIRHGVSNLPGGETQRRDGIYERYLAIVHPQRLTRATPQGEVIV